MKCQYLLENLSAFYQSNIILRFLIRDLLLSCPSDVNQDPALCGFQDSIEADFEANVGFIKKRDKEVSTMKVIFVNLLFIQLFNSRAKE